MKTQSLINNLASIVGKENVSADEEYLQNFAGDETPFVQKVIPSAVVKPSGVREVSRILAWANANHLAIVPRGAGTGLSQGSSALTKSIVLSTEKLDRIIEIDEQNFTATLESGVSLKQIKAEVEPRGLMYPLYPGEMTATIGGNVATNAGGMNAVKYGVTRHHVLGLEAVFADGTVLNTGGKYVKCSTGYDISQLLIGSEGTLAVITRVIVKLVAKPEAREILFLPFDDLQKAIDTVPHILRTGTVPVGIEFMEKNIIDIVEKHLSREIPHHNHAAFLMITAEGNTSEEIYEYFDKLSDVAKNCGAVEAYLPGSEKAKRQLMEAREQFLVALKKFAEFELIDIVVPRSKIAEFIKDVKELSLKRDIPVIAYGHAGDGNVHLHPLKETTVNSKWQQNIRCLMNEIYTVGISYGGAVSGEHGIGNSKKTYLPLQFKKEYLDMLKLIKRSYDPNGILNPGKIVDI